jgi:Cell division septal protein
MPRSTSKYKLYLYLFFLIFLSSIFNFKFLENYQDKFVLKNININGVSFKEKQNIEEELSTLKNINIFKITDNKVLEKLAKFNFIENINVKKIIPSSINVNLSKTSILGKTFINGEEFYIGKNEKFINSNQIYEKFNTPTIFGKFQIKEFINLYNILNNQQLEIDDIEKYYFFKNRRWDLVFSNGLILKLPSKNIINSIKIYKKLLDNYNLANIKIIDLRVNNQIIMTNKNE